MSNNNSENINPDFALEKVITDGNLHDIITDTTQLLTDAPIIGTLVKSMKFISTVHEIIFTKKIQQFLYELKDISQEKRQQKIDEINQSEKLQYSIGLVLLDQLQRIDMNYKPQILGQLFAEFCNENIDLNEYLRLTHIVDNAFFMDLQAFKQNSINGIYQSTDHNSLVGGELMSIDFEKMFNRAAGQQLHDIEGNPLIPLEGEVDYPEISELGKKLLNSMKFK